MAWNPLDGTMYGIAVVCSVQSSLYTIDLASGAATLVCTTDVPSACDVGLTIDGAGNFYGHDIVNDFLEDVDNYGFDRYHF